MYCLFSLKTSSTPKSTTPTNCREFLDKRLQVRWELKGDQVEITLSARMREDQYVAFGLSGAENRPQMVSRYTKLSLVFSKNIVSFLPYLIMVVFKNDCLTCGCILPPITSLALCSIFRSVET